MNRRRLALLAPLVAVLALLCGLTGTASAAFNQPAQNPHYGNFLLWESEASNLHPSAIPVGTGNFSGGYYDFASGRPPWTMFDPLGLASKHEKKWQNVAADEGRNVATRIGAAFMAAGEALNPFRSDSSIRQGGRDLQVGLAEGREELKKAPPGIRELGQLTLGVGSAGTGMLSIPAGLGEIGDSIQQQGAVNTGKQMVTGLVDHAMNNPVEFAGELGVGVMSGKAMLGSKSARLTQVESKISTATTKVTSWAEEGITPDLNPGRWVMKGDATKWNFAKTGLWGPKTSKQFPFVKKSNVPFKNSVTDDVPTSNVVPPKTTPKEPFAVIKRLWGQSKLEE